MPESPLVQNETSSLDDLEALIADRAKGESETELGFRKRIDARRRSTRRRRSSSPASTRSTTRPWRPSTRAQARRSSRPFPARHPGDARTSTPRPSSRSTTSSRKTSAGPRRPRKRPAGRHWRSSRGRATRESSGGGGPRPTGRRAIEDLHVKQETAEVPAQAVRQADASPPPTRPTAILAEWRRADRRGAAARARPRSIPRRPTATRPPRPPSPPSDNPLTRLRADLTRIEEELHRARTRSSSPSSLQISDLHLAVPVPRRRRGRRAGHPADLGWTDRPGSSGASSPSPGRSGPSSAWPRWPGPRSSAMPCRSASSSPTPSRIVEQNKDWIKNEFEAQAQGARGEAGQQGPRGRGEHGPRRRRVRADAARSSTRRPTSSSRPSSSRSAVRRDEQAQESRGALPAAHRRPQGKIREGQAASSTSRTARPRTTTKQAIRAGLGQPDQGLDRGHGADRRGPARRQRGGRAAVPGLDAARARRLEAARPRSRPACGSAPSRST